MNMSEFKVPFCCDIYFIVKRLCFWEGITEWWTHRWVRALEIHVICKKKSRRSDALDSSQWVSHVSHEASASTSKAKIQRLRQDHYLRLPPGPSCCHAKKLLTLEEKSPIIACVSGFRRGTKVKVEIFLVLIHHDPSFTSSIFISLWANDLRWC